MKFTKLEAYKVGKELGIDFRKVKLDCWRKGLNIELEHGKEMKKTNITNDDILKTAKIALAHIIEYPNYYEKLIEMEKKLDKEWKGIKKPKIF